MKKLAALVLVTAMLLALLPASNVSAQGSTLQATVVNAFVLNTRTGPGVQYPVNQKLARGQNIVLIARNANSSWVQLQSGAVEWVNAYYLQIYGDVSTLPVSNAGDSLPQGIAASIANAVYLNTRTGPGVQYPVNQRLVNGQHVVLIGRNANTSWVQLQSGTTEWINASYVQTAGNLYSLPVTDAGATLPQGIAASIANAVYLNTRTGPGVQYPINQQLANGQHVVLIGRNANTSWVQLQSGATEWINAAYVQTAGNLYSLPVTSNTTPVYSYSPAPAVTQRYHVVQAGENLFRIALRYGVSVPMLAAYNGIVNYDQVFAGQTLIIP